MIKVNYNLEYTKYVPVPILSEIGILNWYYQYQYQFEFCVVPSTLYQYQFKYALVQVHKYQYQFQKVVPANCSDI